MPKYGLQYFYKMFLVMEGDEWKQFRSKLSPAFTTYDRQDPTVLFALFQSSSVKNLVHYGIKWTLKQVSEIYFSTVRLKYVCLFVRLSVRRSDKIPAFSVDTHNAILDCVFVC